MRCNNNNTKQWNAWMPPTTCMKKSNGNKREKCTRKKHNHSNNYPN